jgi:hypothetical protein
MPSFLTTAIPDISHTLLALDISANFLHALPPCLASCLCLEELNIASNPLRVLPVFLSHLTALRVLIADATGIFTLPDVFSALDRLHTLSVRRNKMNALPSWLCLLPSLQTLFVDQNPFQGPWKALVEPLLVDRIQPPTNANSSLAPQSPDSKSPDAENSLVMPSADHASELVHSPEQEVTVNLDRRAAQDGSLTPPDSQAQPSPSPKSSLTRTRTAPNRARLREGGNRSLRPLTSASRLSAPKGMEEDQGYFGELGERRLRKMKSAGDLNGPASVAVQPALPSPPRAPNSSLPTSPSPAVRPARFASLGVASGSKANSNRARAAVTTSLWDDGSQESHDTAISSSRLSWAKSGSLSRSHQDDGHVESDAQTSNPQQIPLRPRTNSGVLGSINDSSKEKPKRWGFLKKMSMNKLRVDSPQSLSARPSITQSTTPRPTTSNSAPPSALVQRISRSPQIDLRFSTSGILDALTYPSPSVSPTSSIEKKPSVDALRTAIPSSSQTLLVPSPTSMVPPPTLLVPPLPTPRSMKRRSFLPLDAHPQPHVAAASAPASTLTVPIPSVTLDGEDIATPTSAPGPAAQNIEQAILQEEEKVREAYARALRSVMAYLKDMNDLGWMQIPPPPIPDEPTTPGTPGTPGTRPRRPTAGEGMRAVSEVSSHLGDGAHLRPGNSNGAPRSRSQTFSVSTSSSGYDAAGEERKSKDDKGKRAMVVREIIE